MAERENSDSGQRERATKSTAPPIEGAVGASDANNGGGAGAGVPDADLAARAGDAVTRGDVEKDREKIFPKADQRRPGADAAE